MLVVNEGVDGTMDWVRTQEIDAILSPTNMGICFGMNAARPLIKSEYLVYMNDDMLALPGWDQPLIDTADAQPHDRFMLSATMTEPVETGNDCVVIADCGRNLASFDEAAAIDSMKIKKDDWSGSMWPPNLMPLSLWDRIGGMSVEYSPGMYSDPDLCMKCWHDGVRLFQGIGQSRVYHFGSQSTRRLKKNPGKRTFTRKWQMTPGYFRKTWLKHGQPFTGALPEPPPRSWLQKLKALRAHI